MGQWTGRLGSILGVVVVVMVGGLVGGPAAAVELPSPITEQVDLGFGANEVAFAPDGLFAYVLGHNGTVARIRTSDNTVEARIALSGQSSGQLVMSPDGSFAYVTVRKTGQVDAPDMLERIRTSDNTVVSHIPLSYAPRWITIAPDATFLLLADTQQRLRRIRTSDGHVVADITLPTDRWLLQLRVAPRIAPDGSFAYVDVRSGNGSGGAALARIDLATNTVTGYVPVASPEVSNHYVRPNRIHDLRFSPDGSFATLVSSAASCSDCPDVQQQWRGWLSRVNTGAGAPTRWTPLTDNYPYQLAESLSLSPDGKSAFLITHPSVSRISRVSRISTDALTVESQFSLPSYSTMYGPSEPKMAVFSPSGQFAYALSDYIPWLYRVEWPRRPGIPQAEAFGTGFKVTVAPAGAGITPDSYRITSSPGSQVCIATAPQVSCVVEELTARTAYKFSAVAVNAAGQSEPSEWSAAVSAPAIPPGTPTGVSARAGDRSAQLVFAPPNFTGGLPIVAYEYSTDDGVTWRRPDRDMTATVITIGGLVNDTTYLIRVRAVTVAGVGQPSTPVTVTPRALPSAPRAVSATPKDTFVRVMWQRADSDGGLPITSYRVTARPGGATCETGYLACDVVGLTNGVAYTFSVQAVNASGASVASPSSVPVSPRRSTRTGKVVNWPSDAWDDRFPYSWVDVSDFSASPWNAMHGIALARGAALVGGSARCALTSVVDNCAPAELRTGVTAVKSGWDIGRGVPRFLAIKNGQVYDWSDNYGGNIWWNHVPGGASGTTAIAAGTARGVSYSMAISAGEVFTWGPTQMPVPAEARSGVTAIAAGGDRAAALKGGKVIAWNHSGRFVLPSEWESGVSAIAASDQGFLAIKGGRVLFSEGFWPDPAVVPQVQSGVAAISAAEDHWLALKDDGTVVGGAPAKYQGRFIAIDATRGYSEGLVAPAPPRPPTLVSLPAQQTAPWNANLRVGARYTLPEDTKVTKSMVVVVQASNRKLVGSGPSVPLGRGRYLVTQKIWYMMSNLATGFAQRTQVVSVAKEPPPAPPPPPPPPGPTPAPTYDYLFANGPSPYSPYSAIGIGFSALPTSVNFGAPTWIAVKEQGARVRVFVSNPQRFLGLFGRNWVWVDVPRCFAGTVDNGNASYSNGDVTYSNGARESASAYLGYNKVVLYGLGGRAFGNAMGWQGNGSAPGPTGAATLRRQVDSCG